MSSLDSVSVPKSVEDAVRALIARRDEAEALATQKSADASHLQAQLATASAEIVRLRSKESAMDSACAELAVLLQQRAEADVSYTSQLRALEDRVAALAAAERAAVARAAEVDKERSAAAARADDLASALAAEKQRVAALEARAAAAEAALASERAKVDLLTSQVDDTTIRLSLAEEDVERKAAEYASLLRK